MSEREAAIGAARDWLSVNGDRGGTRYSTLGQINRKTVRELRPVWTYHTGDADPARMTNIECTPVVVDGLLYATTCSPTPDVVALEAATGIQRWRFDPWKDGPERPLLASGGVNRGVAYWSDGRESRILHGTSDGRLFSLDARTGRPDERFGRGGVLDLREGLEPEVRALSYGCTSAPAIFEDTVILGFSNGEGPSPNAPGDVRAFNVRTGKEVWRFRTVPRPGEFGAETWPADGWRQRGGCNNWPGANVDVRNGIVLVATGSPAFDFYGADRKGDNLFGNCVLALDARTGKRLWHYQTVEHDLWDYDNPTPPIACTVTHKGKRVEALAQLTKTGFCFLLDRRTGKPLFEVEERPVPLSTVPGEASSPVQVFPVKPPPISRQGFGPEDVTDIAPANREFVRKRLETVRTGPLFAPTDTQLIVRLPGFHGGASWAGGSFDPTTGRLYVNSNDIPRVHSLIKNAEGSRVPYRSTSLDRFVDQEGYPAVKPPWGNLIAIDLNKGSFAWRTVLGEYPELIARGLPPTGTESLGGTIVTAGGLVFIGGTKDAKFRAFDKSTGKLLWEYRLPHAGYATPCTYMVNGRQYVAIAAGGGGKLATPSGDEYVAFALPSDR